MSTSRSRDICYIESRKDGNQITYLESNGAIVMRKKKARGETGFNQRYIKDPIPGCNKYKLYVDEYDEENQAGDVVEGTKFLECDTTKLFSTTESSDGPNQKWEIIEHIPGVCLIKSEDLYLKNKGPGKPIKVIKKPRNLGDKSLQWRILPVF